MVSQDVKMDAPSPLNGNRRSQKGPAAEGVALKIDKYRYVLQYELLVNNYLNNN